MCFGPMNQSYTSSIILVWALVVSLSQLQESCGDRETYSRNSSKSFIKASLLFMYVFNEYSISDLHLLFCQNGYIFVKS